MNARDMKQTIEHQHGPAPRRWTEQRWLLDGAIQVIGAEWDQPRLNQLVGAIGPEAVADIAGLRQRITKFAHIAPAFEAVAVRREARAKALEEEGDLVGARENFFMAANLWGAAQWPLTSNSEQHHYYNKRKRDCFGEYARLSDHRVEAAWVPFRGKALPGWLHLPPNYAGGRIPAVVIIPGMDGYKERAVPLYGDRWLSRGMAVLILEGPGQYESPLLDIYMSVPAWEETGRAAMDWLAARPEIDAGRVGISGSSFGSLFATLAFAHEPRFRACAVSAICLEPGGRTIFEEASPTFKRRFMYMAGYTDEAAFDAFRASLSWQGHADRIKAPYLCVAGEADELCPVGYADDLMDALTGPKRLVVYQDARHLPAGVPSANLGPYFPTMMAHWMLERLNGKPFVSEKWFIESTGRVRKTPYAA